MIYKLIDLYRMSENRAETPAGWVPARPLPFYGWSGLIMRIKAAWLVLRGKADAVVWPGGQ